MSFFLYLGKVCLCSGILTTYYWLFLRNKRFHHYNRYYLQGTLLLSVVLPFIRIRLGFQSQSIVNQAVYQTLNVLTVDYGEAEGQVAGDNFTTRLFTMDHILYVLYCCGIIVLLVILIRSLFYIWRISKKYPFEKVSDLKFYPTQEPGTPFSFFRSVFWNNELPFNSKEGQQIFRHELFHVRQKHSADVLLAETVTAIFWINPFFHILKKELKAIHEFLADQYAISGSDRYAYAELLVMQTLKAREITISNYFFQNHIKRRIAMITHFNSSKYSYRSRLMALPVSVLLFCTIALYAQQPLATRWDNAGFGSAAKPITVIIDAGHGGIDPGAASRDGAFLEKNLNLQICQKIQQLAPAYNVNVIMTRTNDELPGNTNKISDGLKARTALAKQTGANLLISIHVSSTGPDQVITPDNGFEIYVSNKDNSLAQQSKVFGTALVQSISKLYTINPTIKQRKQNLWVLEQIPCPGVLIECGFITNEKDLAFITNGSNQEAIAKKMLEAIVNYQSQMTAQPGTVQNSETAAPAAAQKMLAVASVQPAVQQIVYQSGDDLVSKIQRQLNRNFTYPNQALTEHRGGTVYFSLVVDQNGQIGNGQLYDKAPSQASKIHELVVIGYAPAGQYQSQAVPIPPSVTNKLLQEEVQSVLNRKILVGATIPQPIQYYFKVTFKAADDSQPIARISRPPSQDKLIRFPRLYKPEGHEPW